MPTVRLDNTAILRLGVFFNDAARVPERHAGFDDFDGGGQTLSRGFDDADGISIGEGFGADVVCFVEVTVEAVVI